MKRVRVERVEVRLVGVSRADASAIAAELRRTLPVELYRGLLGEPGGGEPLRGLHQLEAVRLRARHRGTARGTAQEVSRGVAEAIRSAATPRETLGARSS